MSLKLKIILLSLLPLILVSTAISYVGFKHAHVLSENEIKIFEEHLLASKKREIKHYVELALTSIKHIENDVSMDEPQAKQEIKKILNGLTFGDDGYFFVYDSAGINLVHPILPQLVGKSLINLQDRNGVFVIKNLLKVAVQGGGYFNYVWNKPSSDTLEDKLSYVVQLKRWNWTLGTGLYIDDIAKEVANAREQVKASVEDTFYMVLFIVVAAVVAVALLGVVINLREAHLATTRLQELAHKSVRFYVNERRQFSRELHDGINQLMVSVLFRIELTIKKLKGTQPELNKELEKAQKTLKDAINEVREISHNLRPSLLDDMGLRSALKSLLMDFSERTGIEVDKDFDLPEQRLPEDIEITFYRVAQEALTNTEKHSHADNLKASMWLKAGTIYMCLKDNGIGFEQTNLVSGQGIGLKNMRDRVELLSGLFTIKSAVNEGTSIKVSLTPMFLSECAKGAAK